MVHKKGWFVFFVSMIYNKNIKSVHIQGGHMMKILDWFFNEKEVIVEGLDGCQNAKRVASKYGHILTCPEDEAIEVAVTSDPDCLNAQKVAGKYGYTVTCPE